MRRVRHTNQELQNGKSVNKATELHLASSTTGVLPFLQPIIRHGEVATTSGEPSLNDNAPVQSGTAVDKIETDKTGSYLS